MAQFTATNNTVENYAGRYRTAPAPTLPVGTIQTFSLENTEAAVSPGFRRFGLQFAKGVMKPLIVPVIKLNGVEVDAQFDERVTWADDGSLKNCVCHIRDTDFAALEERTYTVEGVYGEFDNTSSGVIGDITANTDFNMNLTNVQNSSAATHNGGTLTSSMNTHALTASNVTKIHSGSVTDGYFVEGFLEGTSTDDHLRVTYYVNAWKNSGGTIVDYECAAVLAQDRWAVAGKDRLDYDADFRDGVTVIESFSGVQHIYRGQWVTIDTTNNDGRYAKRPWLTSPETLHYKPDRAYMIETGLVPPLNLTADTSSSVDYNTAYTPLGNMDHRAAIDGTGSYQGRGELPDSDTVAFISQDKTKDRYARTNALAGLGIPYHYRHDTENTIIPVILDPQPSSYYTFSEMPTPQHAYIGGSTDAQYQSGYVTHTGGSAPWSNFGTDSSHAVPYSYYQYLVSGERYLMETTLDLAMNLTHQSHGNVYGSCPGILYWDDTYRAGLYSIPTTRYTGIAQLRASQERTVGWALNILAGAYSIVPDTDRQKKYFNAFVGQQFLYASTSISYLPQEQKDTGLYWFKRENHSPWMSNFVALGAAFCKRAVDGLTGVDEMFNVCANYPAFMWGDNRNYVTLAYRGMVTQQKGAWHATNNPFLSSLYGASLTISVVSADNSASFGTPTIDVEHNDTFYWASYDDSANASSIPSDFTEGTLYYFVWSGGSTGNGTLQISDSADGSPIAISSDDSGYAHVRLANENVAVAVNPPYLPNDDSYTAIAKAAAIAVNKIDDTIISDSLVTQIETFFPKGNASTYFAWNYSA